MLWKIVVPIVLLGVLVVTLVVVVRAVRRAATDANPTHHAPWTLSQLIDMRDSGELTVQQYEHLRDQHLENDDGGRGST